MKIMTKQYEEDVNPARVAELELEIEQWKEKYAQREHDTAKIVDELNAAKKGGSGSAWQPRTYLLVFLTFVGVRILATNHCPWLYFGFMGLLAEVLFVGPATVLLWRWACGEIRRDIGNGIVKCVVLAGGLFIASMIFSQGFVLDGNVLVLNGQMSAGAYPAWTLLWLAFLVVILISPFCEWMKERLKQLAQHPVETSRELFVHEDDL